MGTSGWSRYSVSSCCLPLREDRTMHLTSLFCGENWVKRSCTYNTISTENNFIFPPLFLCTSCCILSYYKGCLHSHKKTILVIKCVIFLLIFPFRLLEIIFFILLNLFFLAKNWHFNGVNEKVLGSLILFPSNLFISIDYSFNCAKLGYVIQFSSFQVKLMNYQIQHCLRKSNQTILLTIKEG